MLTIQGLSKQYGDNVVFKSLDLTVQDGEVLSVVGPSGIGKTTFLKILTGLEQADQGAVTLDDKQLEVTTLRQSRDIGVIFQDFNLFPQYTVLQNVALAPITVDGVATKTAHQNARELLASLGMAGKEDLYPYQLSGGQKQRVAIARALAMNPKVLAYDEPTSALDEFSTQQVVQVISELKARGVTQIVITHDLPFAQQIADRTFDFKTDVQR
jgi:polar amino acid transport system ATP-binding protein